MTSVAAREYDFYPQYCFHRSRTINKWCPLRAADIQRLEQRAGFEGQDAVLFHLNHPIRWVRVVGVVVAVDEYAGRRVYTVDDSSGACVECCLTVPARAATEYLPTRPRPGGTVAVDAASGTGGDKTAAGPASASAHPDIDVGMVVDVKGSLNLFRDQTQIKFEQGRMRRIRSTAQEVQFWDKVVAFRADVLDAPWVLEAREVRRLEREQKADAHEVKARRREKGKRWGEETQSRVLVGKVASNRAGEHRSSRMAGLTAHAPRRPSTLRTVTSSTSMEGQYDALGL